MVKPSWTRTIRLTFGTICIAAALSVPLAFAQLRAQCIKKVAIKLYAKDMDGCLTRSNHSIGYDYEPEMVGKMLHLSRGFGKLRGYKVREVHCPIWPLGEVRVAVDVQRDRPGREMLSGSSSSFNTVARIKSR